MAAVENATPTTSSTDAQAIPDEQKPAKRLWMAALGHLPQSMHRTIRLGNQRVLRQPNRRSAFIRPGCQYFGPTILSVALFALGSGLGGGSSSTEMLIAARVIQGLGGGGINVMTEIIVANLVSLRERQQAMGIIFTAFAVGTSIGPVVGGAIVDHTSWRWVFYINLPLCGVTLVLMLLFLHVNYDHQSTVTAKLKRVDFAGNAILITSVISILLALTWAGTTHPWDWASLFLPVYFQSVLEATPEKSGFDLLASVIPMVSGAIVGGVLITVTGKYKPLLVAGFVLMAIGMGLFTMLDDRTNTVRWIVYQVILALGAGISLIATLPAVLASLPESDVATATATWAFLRSLGSHCLEILNLESGKLLQG